MTPEPPAGRRVVVLGASGFLGRHICAAFTAAGSRVTPVSRTAPGAVALDLSRDGRAGLARVLAGARVVVNAAGAVWSGTEQEMAALNAGLVHRLTEVVTGLPERPRLIHLGSAYEYGPVPFGTSIPEDWPPAPTTPYGRTKLQGTRTVVRAAEERGVDGVVLRVSVVCGPGAPRSSLPGIVTEHLTAGRDELRLAPLLAHRDLVDVRDVADAVLAAASAPERVAGAIVNVGGGVAVPVRTLVDLLVALGGRPLRVVEEAASRDTRSDALWQLLDIKRARRTLRWSPRRGLAESMRDLLTAAGLPPGESSTTGAPGVRLEPTIRAPGKDRS
ncbi:NAD-dependent epimerase/dehydratase family protein [Actinomadura macra]|uniref:NAD-dependent epimerase/dehydratase family protein n=1 Tax=Actinomadura macra TaxID=46164 RepID=UPI000ACEC35F|nr:NAD(P)-dependent oxidoreductase [Actinomadura macra]